MKHNPWRVGFRFLERTEGIVVTLKTVRLSYKQVPKYRKHKVDVRGGRRVVTGNVRP